MALRLNHGLVSGNVGIGTTNPVNKLDVNGGMAIGSYAGTNSATSNGLIVGGCVGIGNVTSCAIKSER